MWIVSPSTRNTCVSGAWTCSISCPIPGMSVAKPAVVGPHLEQLDDERVARLGAAHGDRTGGAVHALEVDFGDEVGLRADLPGEAVVRLERDDFAGLDLEHGREVRAECPDHLVPGDAVGCCYAGDGSAPASGEGAVSSST